MLHMELILLLTRRCEYHRYINLCFPLDFFTPLFIYFCDFFWQREDDKAYKAQRDV